MAPYPGFGGKGAQLSFDVNAGARSPDRDVKRPAAARQEAWDEIVDAHAGSVWAVARRQQLTPREAAHVSQVTWLRLADRLGDLSPEAIGSWLAKTAHRESIRAGRLRRAGGEDEARPA